MVALHAHGRVRGGRGAGDRPGKGCYLEDSNGKRYLDALAGLFAVQLGYSHGEEMGQAALAQMRELPFYTNWSYAHPRAIELAHEIASLAPGDLNRVFVAAGRNPDEGAAGDRAVVRVDVGGELDRQRRRPVGCRGHGERDERSHAEIAQATALAAQAEPWTRRRAGR